MDQQIETLIKNIHERVNSIDKRVNDIDKRVNDIDQRTTRIEQMLPTFATKDDLSAFATKDDIREEGERTRRYFDIVSGKSSADAALVAEGHETTKNYVDRELTDVKSTLSAHDARIMRLEADSLARRRRKR